MHVQTFPKNKRHPLGQSVLPGCLVLLNQKAPLKESVIISIFDEKEIDHLICIHQRSFIVLTSNLGMSSQCQDVDIILNYCRGSVQIFHGCPKTADLENILRLANIESIYWKVRPIVLVSMSTIFTEVSGQNIIFTIFMCIVDRGYHYAGS